MTRKRNQAWIFFLTIIVLGLAIYSNALQGEFVSDDHVYIVDNPSVRNIFDLQGLWHSFNSRFLTGLTFALNFSAGGLNVFGYHFFNIVIHLINSILVYQFTLLILKALEGKTDAYKKYKDALPVFAALIFLTHPVQTQGVSFISQRLASMGTMFYLLSLIFYIRGRLDEKNDLIHLALLSMLFGVFTKEMIVTVPLMLFVIELYCFSSWKEIKITQWRTVRPFVLASCMLPLIILQQKAVSYPDFTGQIKAGGFSWNYFLTEINVLRTYARMLFLPVNLSHEYDYPIVGSLLDVDLILSLALLIGLLILAVKTFRSKPLISFCIVWFFVTTSVEIINVSLVHRNVIYDHWLYLPMVGFSIFLGLFIHLIAKDKMGIRGLFAVIIVIFCLATYQRNKVWQNEIGFWQDVLKKAPNKAAAHLGMANAYKRQNNLEKAIEQYQQVVRSDPGSVKAYSNMGVAYYQTGNVKRAMRNLKEALNLEPDNPAVHNNLGYIYYLEKDYGRAILHYFKALNLRGDYANAYFYLGQCYLEMKNFSTARNCLNRAMQLYEKRYEKGKVQEIKTILDAIANEV